jgi:hypothetical protein
VTAIAIVIVSTTLGTVTTTATDVEAVIARAAPSIGTWILHLRGMFAIETNEDAQ